MKFFYPLFFLALLIAPWLNPFAPGPSPSIVPWLITLGAGGCLLLMIETRTASATQSAPDYKHSDSVYFFKQSLLIAGLFSCVLALLQYFDVEAVFSPWVNSTEAGYAFANLRQRNQFASLTSLSLAVVLTWAMGSRASGFIGGAGLPVLCSIGLLAVGNAASASRTGLVQIILLGLLFVTWGGWRLKAVRLILITAVLTYAIAAIALPYLAGMDVSMHGMAARLISGDAPCSSRLTLWSNVLHLIAQKPWLGWGWNELDYAHYITLYNGPRFCEILDNAHNLPLHLAVELGIPAALLICGGFTWWVLRQKPWQETDPTRQLAWSILAIILLHSMLEYPLWYGPFQMAFGLCITMLLFSTKPDEIVRDVSGQGSNSPVGRLVRSSIAIVIIASSVFAAWDYHRISQIYLSPQLRDPAYRVDTLGKIKGSWLFSSQVRFAELLLTPLTRQNAEWTFQNATALLHFSPEPRIIEKVIESAVMLARDDDAVAHLARYRAAFPADYAQWALANARLAAALEGGRPGVFETSPKTNQPYE